MKYIFVPCKFNKPLPPINFLKLPKTIALFSTVQFLHLIPQIKARLESKGIKAMTGKSSNPCLEHAQVIGCDTTAASKLENKVQAFLYVGSGKFHPLNLAMTLKQQKPIFIFNPLTQEFSQLDQKDINKMMARKKGQRLKFLSSDTFGILVSTKPGQNKLEKAQELKEKLEKQGKKAYIFMANDIDPSQTENFPEIQCWINTACPGISLENPFVWVNDLKI